MKNNFKNDLVKIDLISKIHSKQSMAALLWGIFISLEIDNI